MPLLVLIETCPLWMRAAGAGGQMPWPPAWMCMACGCPLRSPFVSTETVAESPRSTTVASPLPDTWLVGTGAVAPLKDWPAGSAGVVVELDAVFLDDPPPLRAITATIT